MGVESRGKRKAHELIAGIRRAAKACGAGNQLVRGFFLDSRVTPSVVANACIRYEVCYE